MIFRTLILYFVVVLKLDGCISDSVGTHFAASCPWSVIDQTVCDAIITTLIKPEVVSICEANKVLSAYISKKKYYLVKPHEPYQFTISVKKGYNHKQPTISYPVWTIQSTGLVTVVIQSRTEDASSADVLNLTPKENCYTSYYSVTSKGYPFITVITFDTDSTHIDIEFPKRKSAQKSFQLDCFADAKCELGATVTLHLGKYQAWYFSLDDDSASLNDVHITSLAPINVISGNSIKAWAKDRGSTSDLCTTSIQPSSTWGKLYMVPNISGLERGFHFSAYKYPLTVTVHQDDLQTLHEINREHDIFEFVQLRGAFFAITSEVPFGLYQFFLSSPRTTTRNWGEVSILNLIPVEQWANGMNYMDVIADHYPSSFAVTYFLLSSVHEDFLTNKGVEFLKQIFVSDLEYSEMKLEWKSFENLNRRQLFYTELDLSRKNTRIYVDKGHASLILYITIRSKTNNIMSLSSYPYNHNQGEIYQETCKSSDTVYPGDDKDNDCDGYIDEEVKNEKDDDFDGKIDEDLMDLNDDGFWSEWTFLCKQPCNDKVLTVRIRSCSNTSGYGKHCEGRNIECDEKICPVDCGDTGRSVSECACNMNCQTCRGNMFECDNCKVGYMSSEHCQKPCPEGMWGIGCLDMAEPNLHGEDVEDGIYASHVGFIVWAFLLALLVTVIALVFFGGDYILALVYGIHDSEESDIESLSVSEAADPDLVDTEPEGPADVGETVDEETVKDLEHSETERENEAEEESIPVIF